MTVGQLKEALKGFADDVEVMTKKTEIFGNVAYVNNVVQDSYAFFGVDIPCVLLTDEFKAVDCTECVLDGTDACPRGAGRAVDSEVCEEFLKEGEEE